MGQYRNIFIEESRLLSFQETEVFVREIIYLQCSIWKQRGAGCVNALGNGDSRG